MSIEANKSLARRYTLELWSKGNLAVADEIIAPNYTVHDPGTPGRQGGPEGDKQTVSLYRSVFPDLHFIVEDLVSEGDKVVIRWTARGTQTGPYYGDAPVWQARDHRWHFHSSHRRRQGR